MYFKTLLHEVSNLRNHIGVLLVGRCDFRLNCLLEVIKLKVLKLLPHVHPTQVEKHKTFFIHKSKCMTNNLEFSQVSHLPSQSAFLQPWSTPLSLIRLMYFEKESTSNDDPRILFLWKWTLSDNHDDRIWSYLSKMAYFVFKGIHNNLLGGVSGSYFQ